jgi:hypothetical protein
MKEGLLLDSDGEPISESHPDYIFFMEGELVVQLKEDREGWI